MFIFHYEDLQQSLRECSHIEGGQKWEPLEREKATGEFKIRS